MGIYQRTRAHDNSALRWTADHRPASRPGGLCALLLLFLFLDTTALHGQSTYQITAASYGSNGLAVIPAGVNGATLALTGTLPNLDQQSRTSLLGCFYTGYGSTAGFPLSAPTSSTTEPLMIPAAAIQAIPQTQFTVANSYSVTALVHIITADGVCDGTTGAAVSNQFSVPVVAPYLGTYTGPTAIPQTNPSTNLQAAPLYLNIPAGGFLSSATQGGATTVTFGSFGSVTLAIPASATSSINVPVPAEFSSSPVETSASLSICNTFIGATNPVCTTPTPAITMTVTGLAASAGTITATPTPVLTSGQTVLTAQFTKAANAGAEANLGARSGTVSFTAPGSTIATAPLVLDTTATFISQATLLTAAASPTPVITPTAGSYTGSQTITITDSLANAAIY